MSQQMHSCYDLKTVLPGHFFMEDEMKYSNKVNKIVYGGDYNPEQWPKEVWKEDMKLLKEAHIDVLTLNVFAWASLQPSEEEYDFSRLDEIMELVGEHGFSVCLATSTAAHPAWMAKKYPDILRVEFNGMKRKFGGRHNSCPNSPTYRKYSVRLAKKLAERYKDCDNLIAWHISNEYGGECYCDNCEKAFRVWLKKKYRTIEELNRAWNTSFWGHTFYEWDEIVLPNLLSEHFEYDRSQFQGMTLDYKRFNSESMLECYKMEYEAVKSVTPNLPVTTNLMGFYKNLDYKMWAKYMDVVAWDNYPANEDTPAQIAMSHDLMRGIKGGTPFLLMEQTPSVTNWLSYNALKRPGVMRLWSYQAVAHGADSVMFFQMRRSIGACEKLHGAIIDHVGTNQTRVYREAQALGKELERIGEETLGAVTEAEVAVYFDWDNWWAIQVLSSFLSAGYSLENGLFMSVRELEALYGKDAMITEEFERLAAGVRMNRPVEQLLAEFGERSGIQDVDHFAQVFGMARRSGGELVEIIRQSAGVIRDKIQVQEEIQTMTAARIFEQKIMNGIPFGMILYIDFTSPGFFDIMYGTWMGRLIMTLCLAFYMGAVMLSGKILDIEI